MPNLATHIRKHRQPWLAYIRIVPISLLEPKAVCPEIFHAIC